jgi:hypothetical protein
MCTATAECRPGWLLATAELGDVHAHFGNWGGASTAWSDALDALIGPYQVGGQRPGPGSCELPAAARSCPVAAGARCKGWG